MKVAVIGAGPSGLAAAYELVQAGARVDIYERGGEIGGLARSLTLWGEPVELGPHFIVQQPDAETQEGVFSFFADAQPYRRSSRILLDDVFYDYPPRAFGVLRQWGVWPSLQAGLSLLAARLGGKDAHQPDAESFVRGALGDVLYRRFFKEYTEKLWGRPCRDLDAMYARGLIGFEGFSFKSALAKLVAPPQVVHQQCVHPAAGLGGVWRQLRHAIEASGGRFHLKSSVEGFRLEGTRVTGLAANGRDHTYDHVLCSIPDQALWRMLPSTSPALGERLASVPVRQLALCYARVRSADVMEDNTVYIYTTSIRAVRVTNFNRFAGRSGEGTLLLEYWLDPGEAIGRNGLEIERVARQDLHRLYGLGNDDLIGWHIEQVAGAYQVPDMNLRPLKDALNQHVQQHAGLTRLGRSGQDLFNYGVIQAMRDGVAASRRVLRGASEQAHPPR